MEQEVLMTTHLEMWSTKFNEARKFRDTAKEEKRGIVEMQKKSQKRHAIVVGTNKSNMCSHRNEQRTFFSSSEETKKVIDRLENLPCQQHSIM